MNNIAIIKQGTGRYLFSLPDNVTLKEGDRVKCSTKRGITDGIAFADSAWVDENVSQLIGKLTGAKFPLKSVVGKMEYQPFEKAQGKPAANPANKYEGMSNRELDREMCHRGMCSARNDGRRKHDCLFADSDCHDVTDADRAEVIKYLLAEDAEAAPKPEGKPTEDKPIKLYCVKDWEAGEWLAKGKVYGTDEHGRFVYEDGSTTENTFANVKDVMRSAIGRFLVPLVKRPAEVGEYVLLDNDDCFCKNKKGDVVKVVDTPYHTTTFCFIGDPTLEYSGGICVCFGSDYTYVLDGYKPTPKAEPEPEYYSGKVVCVSSADSWFTVGKMYEFVNGKVKDNDGDFRTMTIGGHDAKSVDGWNDFFGTSIARFIEFKGEAK